MATFQIPGGLRPPNISASDSSAKAEVPFAGKATDEHNHQMRNGLRHDTPMTGVASQPQHGICSCPVGRACAAFHEAQEAVAAMAALTNGLDEIDPEGISEVIARRDETYRQVRGLVARSRGAWQAKLRVMMVIRDWFGEDAPEVAWFAIDVAFEAGALLDGDPGQDCSCHHTQIEAGLDQAGSAERRGPFSWFVRPRRRTTDTPFAN